MNIQDIRQAIVDNYIDMIVEDAANGNHEVLAGFISGEGATPINELTDDEVMVEAIELGILKI